MLPEEIYHIYNHANGSENLFREERNYYFFLDKMDLHISPVASICAYCLMPNHFHLLIKVRGYDELLESFRAFQKFKNRAIINTEQLQPIAEKVISKSFSNFFSSYAQAVNKVYSRKGSLFMQNFKRETVSDGISFCKVVHYIHANPVHHGFVKDMKDWKFSSYNTFLSANPTKIDRDYVISFFGSMDYFKIYHQQKIDLKIKLPGS